MAEDAKHTPSEYKKDPDILPDRDVLFHDFAEFCIRHGRHVEQLLNDNNEQFRLEGIPPLVDSGIESVTYIPPYTDSGTKNEGTMFVIFDDPEVIKTLQMYVDTTGKVKNMAIDVDSRHLPARESLPEQTEEQKDEMFIRAIESLESGIPDHDPAVRRIEERLRTKFMSYDFIPADELQALNDAHRRFVAWEATRIS